MANSNSERKKQIPLRRSILLTLVTLLVLTTAAPRAHAATSNMTTTFSVQGQDKNGGSIYGTPTETILSENDSSIEFAAYVSSLWSMGALFDGVPSAVTLIDLVNVTSTNFILAWLYIPTVNLGRFNMYVFNYTTGTAYWLKFTGQALTTPNLVPVPYVAVPQLSFTPEVKVVNDIFVNGPNISMAGNNGTFYGERAYALLNLMNVTGSWNELWLLTVGPQGYGFVTVYTFLNDTGHVWANPTLILNNYAFIAYGSGETQATWVAISDPQTG